MKNNIKKEIRTIRTFLNELNRKDYKEIPVSIDEFLDSPEFLGYSTFNGQIVRGVWRRELKQLVLEDSKYLLVLSGAVGTGKTCCALWFMAYIMHRVLCLKDPYKFFNLMRGKKFSVVFFNLTKTLGDSVGYATFQSYLSHSPWFKSHGLVKGSEERGNLHIEFPLFEFVHASPLSRGYSTVGHDVLIAIMDEIDDPDGHVSEKQKLKMVSAYKSTMRRFDSRFVRDGESIGRFMLVSSKQDKYSFLNTFIASMKHESNFHCIEIPIWEAKPKTDYCGKKFPVSIGDIYRNSDVLAEYKDNEIIYDMENVKEVQRQGIEVVWIPVEYYTDFRQNPVESLKELAGISVSALRTSKLFPSEKLLLDCYDATKVNPVSKQTIYLGLNDDIDLLKFLDLNAIRIPFHIPRYCHIDIAYSGKGDALGLGVSCIKGWKKINQEREDGTFTTSKSPVVETDFAMRIKGKQGDKIPLNVVRKFLLDLKKVHRLNIVLVTFDLGLLSEDSKQILERAGMKCDKLSLDTDPNIYRNFVTLTQENRWIYCNDDAYLHFELKNLEDDRIKNRIDHPSEVAEIEILEDGGTREIVIKGSKDKSDGVVGSVESALRNCQTPPDIEIMQQIIDKTKAQSRERKNPFWWADDRSLNLKKTEKVEEKSKGPNTTFEDIFKRATRGR